MVLLIYSTIILSFVKQLILEYKFPLGYGGKLDFCKFFCYRLHVG